MVCFMALNPSIVRSPLGPIRLPKRSWQWRPPEELKQWADQEFGGVRAAFRVLDKEGPEKGDLGWIWDGCQEYWLI